MSRHSTLIVLAVLAIFTFPWALRAQDAKPAASAPDLSGKIVTVTLNDDVGGVLKDARVLSLGDRQFIAGVGVNMGTNDWREGYRVWIPIDKVIQIVEFDTLDDARKAYNTAFQRPDAPNRQRPARQQQPRDGL